MKRWLARLMSVIILFSGCLCLAEDTQEIENADLQETVVTMEGESLGTLSENLRFLLDLTGNDEVRELLKMEEVKSVSSEIIWRVLVWLVQNRPVTMKILAELGITEPDLRCIEKIWDSAERIAATLEDISASEDGKQLQAEALAVKNDPDLQEAAVNFREMATSEDLSKLLDALESSVKSDKAEWEKNGGSLTQEALEKQVDHSSPTGRLILELLSVMEQSEWARESVPKLLKNDNLWRFLAHLSSRNPELDRVLREEFVLITSDPEINVFFRETLLDVQALYKTLKGSESDNAEKGNSASDNTETDHNQKTGEEVTP